MVVPRIKFSKIAFPVRNLSTLSRLPVQNSLNRMSSPKPAVNRLTKISNVLAKKVKLF